MSFTNPVLDAVNAQLASYGIPTASTSVHEESGCRLTDAEYLAAMRVGQSLNGGQMGVGAGWAGRQAQPLAEPPHVCVTAMLVIVCCADTTPCQPASLPACRSRAALACWAS
jgi:hypothetical protein